MARVKEIKRAQKSPGSCTHPGCDHVVQPGEPYRYVKFRYGGKRIKCGQHYFRRGETTQAKVGILWDAQDDALEEVDGAETIEELQAILDSVSQQAEDVRSEYEEAAEHFGGQGENAERAEMVESWISELDQVSFDEYETEEEDDVEEDEDANVRVTADGTDDDEERDDWIEEQRDKARDAINALEM